MTRPQKIAIWLDDERDPAKHGFFTQTSRVQVIWVRTVPEFKKAFLEATNLCCVSFDNDLGRLDGEGKDAYNWMEEEVVTRNLPSFSLRAHTMNPSARIYLEQAFKKLCTFWDNQTN